MAHGDLLEEFITFCNDDQPKDPRRLDLFFNGLAVFPPEKESLLQAFLYFSISEFFPSARELLLYERPPDRDGHQNKGKVDFVYRTVDDHLLVIETKYFLPKYHSQNGEVSNRKGTTKRRKKNSDRNKVIKQAIENRDLISKEWNIPLEAFRCAVFTNDSHMEERASDKGLKNGYVRTHVLESWHKDRLDLIGKD